MKKLQNISIQKKVLKFTAALLMCCCLLFLTGANFFVYKTIDKSKVQQSSKNTQDQETPGEEESSKLGSNLNIQEEYVHEFHLQHQVILTEQSVQYPLHNEEKSLMVHYELISPPPDLS